MVSHDGFLVVGWPFSRILYRSLFQRTDHPSFSRCPILRFLHRLYTMGTGMTGTNRQNSFYDCQNKSVRWFNELASSALIDHTRPLRTCISSNVRMLCQFRPKIYRKFTNIYESTVREITRHSYSYSYPRCNLGYFVTRSRFSKMVRNFWTADVYVFIENLNMQKCRERVCNVKLYLKYRHIFKIE